MRKVVCVLYMALEKKSTAGMSNEPGGQLTSKSTGMCGHKMEGYGSFLGL